MRLFKKQTARYIPAVCYILSLLTLFLPWCYFDAEIDGIQRGIDLINPFILIPLAILTLSGILSAKSSTGKRVTFLLLLIHSIVYLICGLFWYVPLITDFNLLVSLETLHYGFYLSLLCSILAWVFAL